MTRREKPKQARRRKPDPINVFAERHPPPYNYADFDGTRLLVDKNHEIIDISLLERAIGKLGRNK